MRHHPWPILRLSSFGIPTQNVSDMTLLPNHSSCTNTASGQELFPPESLTSSSGFVHIGISDYRVDVCKSLSVGHCSHWATRRCDDHVPVRGLCPTSFDFIVRAQRAIRAQNERAHVGRQRQTSWCLSSAWLHGFSSLGRHNAAGKSHSGTVERDKVATA